MFSAILIVVAKSVPKQKNKLTFWVAFDACTGEQNFAQAQFRNGTSIIVATNKKRT
jgi:hypothetical protein